MATTTATIRLQRELRELFKNPPPHVQARPNPANILEWHYVLDGPPGTPFEGGQYWGKLIFPPAYPFKPPSVLMLTPNGRFQPNARICMSMSDYHPETWNPLWSVASILTGLLSFMCDSATTAGSIQTTDAAKRNLAQHSKTYNAKCAAFKKLFLELSASASEVKPAALSSSGREQQVDGSALRNRSRRAGESKDGTNIQGKGAESKSHDGDASDEEGKKEGDKLWLFVAPVLLILAACTAALALYIRQH